MAKADDPRRNYNMTDADLCMFASNLVNDLTTDLPDLAAFGVTAPNIAALKALGDAFEVLPTDIEIEAAVMEATEAKNELEEQLKEGIRNLALRVELKWGVDSVKYRTLKITGMNNMTDNDLIFVARRVLRMMTTYLPDLTAEGLTQSMLDDFSDLIDDYEEAKNLQHDKMDVRADASLNRLTAGNTLYAQVVKYCEIGKRVFVNSNPVRYKCYVIYESSSPGSLTAPTGLGFFFPSTNFFWDAVNNATSYNLEASTDGTDFFEIYSGAEPEFSYTPIQEGWMWYRVRARNAGGFGPFSEVFQLGYYPGSQLPTPVNLALQVETGTTNSLKLTWDVVPSATKYSVNKSVVPIGAAAGPFNLAKNVYSNEYFEEVDAGHRYYYNLTASNGNQWSSVSANVFIDMP